LKNPFHIRLPATSANLGPAFDTAAVALSLKLDITAEPAEEFSVVAAGRDASACGKLEGNLILETYKQILATESRAAMPLRMHVNNEIPLGMGCGSSAAARLAGIALAIHFGQLDWRAEDVIDVATALEGHPDNVSACWYGGMTVSAVSPTTNCRSGHGDIDARARLSPVNVARLSVPLHWRPVLVLPRESMRTEESRQVLPDRYSRADTVANLQHTALLVAAFGSADSELLRAAMYDRVHHPYRSAICPILGKLQTMAQARGVLGVALSGAGPGVLIIAEKALEKRELQRLIHAKLGAPGDAETIFCEFQSEGLGSMLECVHSKRDVGLE
jgi:homoserine kinase